MPARIHIVLGTAEKERLPVWRIETLDSALNLARARMSAIFDRALASTLCPA